MYHKLDALLFMPIATINIILLNDMSPVILSLYYSSLQNILMKLYSCMQSRYLTHFFHTEANQSSPCSKDHL